MIKTIIVIIIVFCVLAVGGFFIYKKFFVKKDKVFYIAEQKTEIKKRYAAEKKRLKDNTDAEVKKLNARMNQYLNELNEDFEDMKELGTYTKEYEDSVLSAEGYERTAKYNIIMTELGFGLAALESKMKTELASLDAGTRSEHFI